MALNQPTPIDPELLITIFQTDVKKESLPMDVFDMRSGLYSVSETPAAIPDVIYLKLDKGANKARTVKVPMLKALSGEPTLGSSQEQLGREENPQHKYFQAYYNDVSHAVAEDYYGILARDKMPYGQLSQTVTLLGTYFKEYHGKMRRQALVERVSENLLEDPHNLPSAFSPNWYFAGLQNNQQPVYEADHDDWTNALASGMDQAGTGTGSAIDTVYCQNLQEWASDFIEPIDLGGGKMGYVVLIPSPQATWLKNPVHTTALGNIWRDAGKMTPEERFTYPGILGDIDMLRFVEDQRYPTVTPGGTGDNRTLSVRYRAMGRRGILSDPRGKTSIDRQLGFLLGKASLMEWNPEAFHQETEDENYKKRGGRGLFESISVMQPTYNVSEDADDSTLQQDGSIVLCFAPPPNWSGRTMPAGVENTNSLQEV